MCINVEHISVIFIFLSQLPHGADCLPHWSLRFNGHKGIGSHLRPPVTKHSTSTDKRGEGKTVVNQCPSCFCYCMSGSHRWRLPIITSVFSLSSLLPLDHLGVFVISVHYLIFIYHFKTTLTLTPFFFVKKRGGGC